MPNKSEIFFLSRKRGNEEEGGVQEARVGIRHDLYMADPQNRRDPEEEYGDLEEDEKWV